MHIEQRKITVGEVAEGYFNDAEEGVTGYGERLDIRPKYQREFVYNNAQRDEVIRTIVKGLPLNVMYWCVTGDDAYEVMDGQQRAIAFCEYIDGAFSVDDKYFYNMPSDQKKAILDYELFIYVCDGTDSEKLDWFRIINIAGEKLTDQELRNAVYAGSWTSDAKRYFSKTGCAAQGMAGDYLKGASVTGGVASAAALPSQPATGSQKPPHQPPAVPRALGQHPGRSQPTPPATAAQASPHGLRACVGTAGDAGHRRTRHTRPQGITRRSERPNQQSAESAARGRWPASPRRSPWPPRLATPETPALDTTPPARYSQRRRPATHPGTRNTRCRVSGCANRYSVLLRLTPSFEG